MNDDTRDQEWRGQVWSIAYSFSFFGVQSGRKSLSILLDFLLHTRFPFRVEVPLYLCLGYSRYIVCVRVRRCWSRGYDAFKAILAMKENDEGLSTYWKDKDSNSNES